MLDGDTPRELIFKLVLRVGSCIENQRLSLLVINASLRNGLILHGLHLIPKEITKKSLILIFMLVEMLLKDAYNVSPL
jgi:hypothetical protein